MEIIGSDEKLIKDYLNGDEHALRLLIEKNIKTIYNFVFQYVGDKDDADDITQETFVKVWKNIKKYKTGGTFKFWLFRIAKNTALDHIKKKRPVTFSSLEKKDSDLNLVENITDPFPFPDEMMRRTNAAEILNKAVKKLAAPYRVILFLYYHDGLNFRQIAETLEEPLDTIKSRHRRALLTLRKELETTFSP